MRDTIPTSRRFAPQEPDGLSVGVSRRKNRRGVRDRKGSRSARGRRETIQEVSLLLSPKPESFAVLVTGESMWPVLVPGQRYTAQRNAEPKLGDIVVARHLVDPTQTIVKRITAIYPTSDIRSPTFRLSGTVSWSSTFTVTRPQIFGVIDR